ncbi:AMP-binding protein [Pseudonocardia sp. C8]|uniref:class I adenylate-forming enzyme family protein n=1 Tax=Pseudonocardia sp. C8 TaxID=2762759 RepID=UPI0016424FBA|nr:AMP-binding protein [Pseudonocardia sp. C8]MBC3193046.1 AMP-binding protein [Pseudonocardia sp. C8]
MYTYDPAPFREWFERDFTYLAGFRRTVRRFGRRTAMVDPDTGVAETYAELGDRVDALARGLRAAGVRPGDVVTHQLYNSADFARLYLATQAAGAVGSPVNFRLAAGEVAHVLDDSLPRVFVYDTELTATVRDALEIATHRPELVVASGGDDPLPGAVRIAELERTGVDARPADAAPGDPLPDPGRTAYDETTRLYISGTTGLPKGVPLNSMVEVFSAHDVIMHFPLGPEDRTLNMTPWFHRGGLYSGGPNPVFYVGAGLVPLRTFDPHRVLDLVGEHGLTYLIGAPTNLEMLARAQADRPRDLSSLRGIVTMGAPLEREACLRYQQVLTPRIFNGYGTTETFWNTFLRPDDLPEHAGSAGRACTDDDVRVVRIDDAGHSDPDSVVARDGTEVGEVVVRSPKCGYAYSGDVDQSRFAGGWVRLGDLATWDSDEFVTIVGRKDDMLVSGGENVHPPLTATGKKIHYKAAEQAADDDARGLFEPTGAHR